MCIYIVECDQDW